MMMSFSSSSFFSCALRHLRQGPRQEEGHLEPPRAIPHRRLGRQSVAQAVDHLLLPLLQGHLGSVPHQVALRLAD